MKCVVVALVIVIVAVGLFRLCDRKVEKFRGRRGLY